MSRALSSLASSKLKSWEGLVFYAYDDKDGSFPKKRIMPGDKILGTLSIAYGHTGSDVHPGDTCTQEQADAWFEKDTAWACDTVEKYVTTDLNDEQFGALVSFVYNIGPELFKTSSVLEDLNARNYSKVPADMQRYIYTTVNGKKVVDDGLKTRRQQEVALWNTNQYVPSASMIVEPPPTFWQQAHNKARAVGTGIAASGVSATALTNASDKFNQLAQTVHFLAPYFAAAGITLAVVGAVWQIFKSDT